MLRGKLPLVGAALVGLSFVHPANGDQKWWLKPKSGTFGDKTCWTPSGSPLAADSAYFDRDGAPYTVTFTANQASRQVKFGHDRVVFNLGKKTYTLKSTQAPSMLLGADPGDVAWFTVRNGEIRAVNALLGSAVNSQGNVTIAANAVWNNSAGITVGGQGYGYLAVNHGGRVSSNVAFIATQAGSSGKVAVGADDSHWNVATSVQIGGASAGDGILDVRPGGFVDVGQLVDVRHSGTLKIQGGTLTTANLSSTGVVQFISGTLHITQSDLLIGTGGPLGTDVHLGVSTQNIPDPAQNLVVDHTINIVAQSELAMDGGRVTTSLLSNSGRFSLNADGARLNGNLDNLTGGIVAVTAPHASFTGTVVHDGADFSVAAGSVATFLGDASGSSNFTGGGQLVFQTSYTPTKSPLGPVANAYPAPLFNSVPLPVSVTGSVNFVPGSSLNLSLGSDYYNQLLVSGAVTLADVNVTALIAAEGNSVTGHAYWPEPGDSFTLVTGQAITYNGAINVPSLPNGLSFEVVESPQSLVIQIIPEPTTISMAAAAGLLSLLGRRARRSTR